MSKLSVMSILQVSTCNLEFMRAYALAQCEQLRYFETGGQAGASNSYSPPQVPVAASSA